MAKKGKTGFEKGGSYKTNDPKAPYGHKADGTVRRKPGAKKGSTRTTK